MYVYGIKIYIDASVFRSTDIHIYTYVYEYIFVYIICAKYFWHFFCVSKFNLTKHFHIPGECRNLQVQRIIIIIIINFELALVIIAIIIIYYQFLSMNC